MVTYTWFNEDTYTKFLKRFRFNEEQIDFLIEQRNSFENEKRNVETVTCVSCGKSKDECFFDYDSYERDLWYVMNRSGLFEDDEGNKTGIVNWTPHETRIYITEVSY